MSTEQIQALAGFLMANLAGPADCSNRMTLTTEWLRRNGLDVEVTLRWLQLHGAFCDCEVLLNVEPLELG